MHINLRLDQIESVSRLRMRRYFTPKAGGLKCSAEALQMWKDPKQRHLAGIDSSCSFHLGGELTKLFLEHGNFNDMEIAVKKRHVRQNSQKQEGGWYTKHKLEHSECWTKSFGGIKLSSQLFQQRPEGHDYEGLAVGQGQQPLQGQTNPRRRGGLHHHPRWVRDEGRGV